MADVKSKIPYMFSLFQYSDFGILHSVIFGVADYESEIRLSK